MSEKNGGPYTKSEQEKRRVQVYEMHFQKSQSALHIAETLGVNRHTIEEDIRYWYSELTSEFEKLNVADLFARQYERLEEQRARLVLLLEKQQDIHHIIKIEKMIFDLDCTITKMVMPVLERKTKQIPDKDAIEVAEHLILDDQYGKATGYSDKELLKDITKYKNCDVVDAQKILDRIKTLGLDLYKQDDIIIDVPRYDLLGFAESRNILSDEKLQVIYSKIEQREKEQKEEIAKLRAFEKQIEAKLEAKYGPQKGWSKEVWREFDAESDGFESLP